MIELKLAAEPFIFKNETFMNYYDFFIYSVDNSVIGIVRFDLKKPSLTEILFDGLNNNFTNKDALIRTALNYFLRHDKKECYLNDENFKFFIDFYSGENVIQNNWIQLEKFFLIGCTH
ncbi:MAG: hypothetical protein JW702_10100 [Clostridiales bacterium]|nr:hypothetical protein [Clostridiales bacterium]